ncbi:retropepsin-like aspartic protease family protein [Mangrovibrevibacter kandeliae]|uniref:retropepsin-like aspartic protease family protein n=1 Tax=Mangrovibrevibacter kandeliae TaxID=2968473 RepID=UPI0021191B19|nr:MULTISPECIES: TIGR02281 family clan AA aspartic protease [unclassified Aurantimonas]MCQ8781264.1 TIGR02281 family clan AA aspartic protease [Aurantimonas sp. CSK15Z-1]MCW4114046.1 TIGR02281 family clan AA aspartic protease [Aurantimonas sp. MSK8Z-1]
MRALAILIGLIAICAVAALLMTSPDADGVFAGLQQQDNARLVYYGIWAAVLGGGVIAAARANLGAALRNLLIWTLAFLVLIGFYAFKDDLQFVGNRMLAVLVPGRAVETAGGDGRELMVTRGRDGHFHLDAKVDGRSVTFLVDTGASTVALDRNVAEQIGIDTAQLRFVDRVMTANGVARAARLRLDSIAIGGIERRDVEATVMENNALGESLLGMSFLSQLSGFEFSGDRLILKD